MCNSSYVLFVMYLPLPYAALEPRQTAHSSVLELAGFVTILFCATKAVAEKCIHFVELCALHNLAAKSLASTPSKHFYTDLLNGSNEHIHEGTISSEESHYLKWQIR